METHPDAGEDDLDRWLLRRHERLRRLTLLFGTVLPLLALLLVAVNRAAALLLIGLAFVLAGACWWSARAVAGQIGAHDPPPAVLARTDPPAPPSEPSRPPSPDAPTSTDLVESRPIVLDERHLDPDHPLGDEGQLILLTDDVDLVEAAKRLAATGRVGVIERWPAFALPSRPALANGPSTA